MRLKDFKNEFRLICTDTWGNAMDASFECLGRIYVRNSPIDPKWNYSPAKGSPVEKDSYFHDLFNNSTTEDLIKISEFLYRYLGFLKYKGIDY